MIKLDEELLHFLELVLITRCDGYLHLAMDHLSDILTNLESVLVPPHFDVQLNETQRHLILAKLLIQRIIFGQKLVEQVSMWRPLKELQHIFDLFLCFQVVCPFHFDGSQCQLLGLECSIFGLRQEVGVLPVLRALSIII